MAFLLYTYSVTSIRAAKRNAQLHREADGGQLDMRRESLRHHGVLEKVEGTRGYELFRDARPKRKEEKAESKHMGGMKAQPYGTGLVDGRAPEEKEANEGRTETERELGGYKGRGGIEKIKIGARNEQQTS